MTVLEAADAMDRAVDGLEDAVRRAEAKTLDEAKSLAIQLSSGTLSYGDLRDLDHPFAKRHPQPLADPSLVNDHGGPFARSWAVYGPEQYGGGTLSIVYNSSPEAEFVLSEGGTKFTVERTLPERLLGEILQPRLTNLATEIDALFG